MKKASAIVLLGHGSRDPNWRKRIEDMAEYIARQRPDSTIRVAWLELCTPELTDLADQLASEGCTSLCILPLFISAGNHVRKDIPERLQHIRERHPDLEIECLPFIGETAGFMTLVCQQLEHR
jgi:sirohydrochlorin cobaltochelatase